MTTELRQFIQKQNAPMGQRNFPGPGLAAGEKLVDVLTGDLYAINPGRTVSITVPSLSGVILVNPVGDFNSDGDIDMIDFAGLLLYWMDEECLAPNWCNGRDLNKNGVVDMADLATFMSGWLGEAPYQCYEG